MHGWEKFNPSLRGNWCLRTRNRFRVIKLSQVDSGQLRKSRIFNSGFANFEKTISKFPLILKNCASTKNCICGFVPFQLKCIITCYLFWTVNKEPVDKLRTFLSSFYVPEYLADKFSPVLETEILLHWILGVIDRFIPSHGRLKSGDEYLGTALRDAFPQQLLANCYLSDCLFTFLMKYMYAVNLRNIVTLNSRFKLYHFVIRCSDLCVRPFGV